MLVRHQSYVCLDSQVRAEAERERHERSEEGAVHGSLGVFYVGCTCGGQKK